MKRASAMIFVLLILLASCLFLAKPTCASANGENSWVSKAPMHEARNNLGVAVANGKIYAIGGDTLSGFWTYSMGLSGAPTGKAVGTNEEYDPKPQPFPSTIVALSVVAVVVVVGVGLIVYLRKIRR